MGAASFKTLNRRYMSSESYPKVYLYKRIVQAKLFIDNHYAEKIDVDNISDEAFFSKFHFIRLFKQIYGKTPHQYLTSVRIQQAIRLFEKSHPVAAVCNAVGFESSSAFGSLFKRMVGQTPSAFLQEQQQKKAQILETPLKFVPGCFAYQHGWDKK
jgi:AraC-like DNA-binding protein